MGVMPVRAHSIMDFVTLGQVADMIVKSMPHKPNKRILFVFIAIISGFVYN